MKKIAAQLVVYQLDVCQLESTNLQMDLTMLEAEYTEKWTVLRKIKVKQWHLSQETKIVHLSLGKS